jgi:carboxyl-terminal processing protease
MLPSFVVALVLSGASPAADRPTAAEVRRHLEPVDSSPELREAATAFADSVAEVIGMVHEHAVFEAAPEQLARLAIMELFTQSARKLPADLLERLNEARGLSPEQVRRLLYAAHLRARAEGDPVALRDKVLRGMMRAVDPSSNWITSPTPFRSGEYRPPCGVGLRLQPDRASGMVRVVTPVRNGPAHVAGIRAGDLLTAVVLIEDDYGNPLAALKVISTRGQSVAEVNAKLQGRGRTQVALSIRRDNGPVRTLRVRRGRVREAAVRGWRWQAEDGWDYWLDPVRHIAYVRLTAFGRRSAQELEATLDGLERQGMRGLVLDLRFNPGGLLNPAVEIADLFIKDGLIARVWCRTEAETRFDGKREGSRLGFPLACLVNGDSKASSEVVAACLQDHKRAVIVGERSRGYARVQNVIAADKPEGCELQLTTAVFLRPSGRKLDRILLRGHDGDEWGVTPDRGLAVPLPDRELARLREYLDSRDWVLRDEQPDRMRHFRDRQRDQALAYLRGRIAEGLTEPRR